MVEGKGMDKRARELCRHPQIARVRKWGAADLSQRRRDEALPYNAVEAVPKPSEHEPPLSTKEATTLLYLCIQSADRRHILLGLMQDDGIG